MVFFLCVLSLCLLTKPFVLAFVATDDNGLAIAVVVNVAEGVIVLVVVEEYDGIMKEDTTPGTKSRRLKRAKRNGDNIIVVVT